MQTKILTIIDYGAGNLRSVAKAMEYVAASAQMPVTIHISSDVEAVLQSTHIILPGVGAFGDCMRGLQQLSGMITALEKQVLQKQIPFLGICVGMQMLLEYGHEHGRHQGLGWFKGEVLPLSPADKTLKIPHMGWNNLFFTGAKAAPDPTLRAAPCADINLLFTNIENRAHAYFVHSYHCAMQHEEEIIATTDYGGAVTAAIARGNIMAVQFHPEKSQETGLRLFENFLNMPHATSR